MYTVHHLKRNPVIIYYGTKMKSDAGKPLVMDFPDLARNTRVMDTLVARPLLTPFAQKLFRYEQSVFMSTSLYGCF
jgi:hypothetical protein